MSKYNVCVYAISKNEESFVDRWMDSVSEADLVVVVDTGSEDRTVEKLRERGASVIEGTITPWRFDVARNLALSHLPAGTDICVSIDLDEVFEPGWREVLENSWLPEHTQAGFWYVWSHRSDGTAEKCFVREKIHSRQGFRWVHPVHEILEYSGDTGKTIFINDLVLHHYPDLQKPREQYLPLLELSAEENPQDSSTIFWLGREYIYHGKNDEGIRTLQQHLSLPSATWEEERSASMRFIARAYLAKKMEKEAWRWLLKAAAECLFVREPYLDLACFGYETRDWPLTFWAVEQGLKIENSSGSYLAEPLSWDHTFYDVGAISCYYLELYPKAYDYCLHACNLNPDDQRLRDNLALIQEKLDGETAYEPL